MKKYRKTLSILFSVGIFLYIFLNDNIKYQIFNFITSFIQEKYEKSHYFQFKVPNEWFVVRRDDDYTSFIGPVWSDDKKLTSIKVFTNHDNLELYINYFNIENCKDMDSIVQIQNSILFKTETNRIIDSEGKIIFCNSDDNNESYLSYSNKLAITTILIKPYSKDYKEKYIELFKNIDFIISADKIPNWIKEK